MATIEELSPEDARAARLGALLLRKNPDIAKRAKRLAKEADPTLQLPEIDLEDQIAAANAKQDEKIEQVMHRNLELEARERRRDETEKSKAEGLDHTAVEKIVVEEKCSYATARKFLKAQLESAVPTAAEVRGNAPGEPIDMRPEEEWRKIGQNRGALMRRAANVAHEMIDSFRGRRAAAR